MFGVMAEMIKILYVDADENARKAFCQLFVADEGYEISVAESAAAGLMVLEEQSARLVVADFCIPEMDGVQFLIKVCEKWPDTLRIVLAGYADTDSVVEAINQGQIYKFVPKPWNDEELKSTILTILQHQDLQQENARLHKELQIKNTQLEAINENLEQMVAQRTGALEIRNKVLKIAQGVLDVLPVAVFGIDAEQMIVQCNDFACELFPAGFMGPLGRDRHDVFPDEVNRVVDLIEADHTPSVLVAVKKRNYRVEVRRLDETLTQGIVLLMIPEWGVKT
jgi:FixJ family two-component response regulator